MSPHLSKILTLFGLRVGTKETYFMEVSEISTPILGKEM
jgi:hypothetical protein